MSNNNQSNQVIKWMVAVGDLALLNAIVYVVAHMRHWVDVWPEREFVNFVLVCNISLIIGQMWYSTVIHQRLIGAGEIVRRVFGLSVVTIVVAYLLLRVIGSYQHVGWVLLGIGIVFLVLMLLKRLVERWIIRKVRGFGRNLRTVTLVGSDPELLTVCEKLQSEASYGYKVIGYYADREIGEWTHSIEDGTEKKEGDLPPPSHSKKDHSDIKRLGTMTEFLEGLNNPDSLELGDELYLSISRRDKKIIKKVSQMCDHKVVRFFYVPVSVESIGLNLKRELLDDVEVYSTYENPLMNPANKFLKRSFDILFSLVFLIPTAILFPFIFLIIKIQSPGPILFKQKRTGIDGKDFYCYKFRSMHVNADADRVQATKDDPRKYPFGNFMRKANIDELPQFLNVLKGDMSIVGPRPHMLAHTEMYSEQIGTYMVRHFVKPGVTGWAQVTGFRGETKELWQMEERVKRDIWYMENWTMWLDIRIIWMTFKTIFFHDKNAY